MATSYRSAPPFRAEQMGSLLRPDNLLEVRASIRDKGISEEEAGLPAVEKQAVADAIKMQQDLGFKAVTSGEFNRTRFWGSMVGHPPSPANRDGQHRESERLTCDAVG